ncbi:MAG: tetratricopeptide repeat protein, partial [Planctomycetes bacterium]|nr:tetratricopeptide repeat protein [Planctomycetota bacterium]
ISRFAKWANNVAMIVLVFILIALGTLTWQQSRIYENVETLWRDTLKKNPNAWIAHNNLADFLQKQGRLDEAIQLYHQALEVRPGFIEAHNNLGVALKLQGKVDEAIYQYRQALRSNPNYANRT